MKTVTIFFLFLFGMSVSGQVGIGTTAPNAKLDIRSTNQSSPAINDGLLIPKVDDFPSTNPGANQDGMMVYATGAGTPVKGFYYWDNSVSAWIPFISGGSSEWIDNGTYLSPADGNDEDVTIGGSNNTAARLTVRSDKPITALFTNSSTQDAVMYGVNTFLTNDTSTSGALTIGNYNDILSEGASQMIGDYNRVRGTGTGPYYGEYNTVDAVASHSYFGNFNLLTGIGSGTVSGVSTVLSNTGSGTHKGIDNTLTGTATGLQYGVYNDLSVSGDGTHYGVYNRVLQSGDGTHYGSYSQLGGIGDGLQYGSYHLINNDGDSDHFGVYNQLGADGNGFHYGIFSELNGGGSATHYGIYNRLSGSGSGIQYGLYQEITNTGGASHYGTFNSITGNSTSPDYGTLNSLQGTGTGIKYGCANLMDPGAGGTHYGIYSEALKSGSYAAYLVGTVAIGYPSTSMYYLPGSRGSNGQVMQTDGAGNVSWVTPTDTDTSPAWYNEASTNAATTTSADIIRNGNVGLGVTSANYRLDVYDDRGDTAINISLSDASTAPSTFPSYGIRTHLDNKNSGLSTGVSYGMENFIEILTDDGYGIRNQIVSSLASSSNIFGAYQQLNHNGTGNAYGTYNLISGTNGTNYGSYNDVAGAGYGVYSRALATGAFAGYFLGNVAIGTSTVNTYRLPESRGSNGQIMQTDGSGQVSWVNAPVSGAQRINDLVDGRSDFDGTDNGSSIYLGINSGMNDDGTNNRNVGVGYNTLLGNTTGSANVALGHSALGSNSSGQLNIAVGELSLGFNTDGDANVGMGYYALYDNTEGNNNIALGNQTLSSNSTADENVAVGAFGLYQNITGNFNTALGSRAISNNTTGSRNIAIGYQAGDNLVTVGANVPNNNIAIGYLAYPFEPSGSNQLSIGNLIYGSGLDGAANTVSSGNIGIGLKEPLDKLEVRGRTRLSTSSSNALTIRNDDNYNHSNDNNIDFGDEVDAWMVSSKDGTNENSGIYGDRDYVVVWAPADNGRMIRFLDEDAWSDNDGDPYNNSAEMAYVDSAGQFVQASDKHRKQNIKAIKDAMTKINQVSGYTYQYKLSASERQKGNLPTTTSGVLAQEIQQVLPEAVQQNENGELFVHYSGIIPLLIEGMKEQQQEIQKLKTELNQLRKLEDRIKKLEALVK